MNKSDLYKMKKDEVKDLIIEKVDNADKINDLNIEEMKKDELIDFYLANFFEEENEDNKDEKTTVLNS